MATKEREKEKSVAHSDKAQVPSTIVDYGDDSGKGFEGQTRDDYSIPFLNLLQTNNPEVEDNGAKQVAGAKPGMFLNTVTQVVYPAEGIHFVPCHTKHVFVEWIPRDEGGGFIAVHELTSEVVVKAKAESTKFGKYKIGTHDLVETFYIYGVTYQGKIPGEIMVFAFTSTKIKAYKDYNTRMNTLTVPDGKGGKVRPPLFANRVKLSSFKTKNDKGTFHNVKFDPAIGNSLLESLLNPGSPEDAAIFGQAKAARELVVSGEAKADYTSQEQTTGAGEEAGNETADPTKAPF